MSCCLFSCSSFTRPSFPLPPSIALNNFGVSCFCPKRLAKPFGCCTGGPGAGFPFSFSSTLEKGRNENTQQCCETEQSSCRAKVMFMDKNTAILFILRSSGKNKAGKLKGFTRGPGRVRGYCSDLELLTYTLEKKCRCQIKVLQSR